MGHERFDTRSAGSFAADVCRIRQQRCAKLGQLRPCNIAGRRCRRQGLAKATPEVAGTCAQIGKSDAKLNDLCPKIEVDRETSELRADGVVLTCEPAATCRWHNAISRTEAREGMPRCSKNVAPQCCYAERAVP